MNLRAIASKTVFRQPRLDVCSVQAFVAGLCGCIVFLGAITTISSPERMFAEDVRLEDIFAVGVGVVPLLLWSIARSLNDKPTLFRTEVNNFWLDVAKTYLDILPVFGAFMFGGLALLAIALIKGTEPDVMRVHRLLNDMGGALKLLLAFGMIGALPVIFGSVAGFTASSLFRK